MELNDINVFAAIILAICQDIVILCLSQVFLSSSYAVYMVWSIN